MIKFSGRKSCVNSSPSFHLNTDVERVLKAQSIEFTKKNQSATCLVFANKDAALVGYFTTAIKPISVNADSFSNTMKRNIAKVSESDEASSTYSLSVYLIEQLGKNYTNGANKRITGKQLLQAVVDTIKELQYIAGGMVAFLESEYGEKLIDLYEEKNRSKRFANKEIKAGTEDAHTLNQFLKVL